MGLTIAIDELGDELRRRRKDLDLSLRDVEEITEVSSATLSRIERGSMPDLGIVAKLANWLGVTVQATGAKPRREGSDEELKRTIEVHLRANKKVPPGLAKTIADSFDFVMRVELERAKAKKRT
jgi:transcriptional regulator with XRE-family HTH domain